MNCIKVLTDKDFGLEMKKLVNPTIRYGARGIIFDEDGNIAILNKQNKNAYKLVGGGLDNREMPYQAFKREVLEESGAKITDINQIGVVEEYRTLDNFHQTSYVFTARVISKGNTNYTKEELNSGSRVLWVSMKDAINLIKNCEESLIIGNKKDLYHSKFIVRRDYEILKYYLNN